MLIGILGTAGSGKDTASKHLVQRHGFYSLALADPIKIYCQWMFGWTPEQLWGSSNKRNVVDDAMGITPRVVLQSLGDWVRGYKKDAYIDFALQRVEVAQTKAVGDDPLFSKLPYSIRQTRWASSKHSLDCILAKHIVISDVRFKNEIAKIKEKGGKIIRLDRSVRAIDVRKNILEHISESEQASIDPQEINYAIINDGPKEDLYNALDTFTKENK
jgi:hypothetical protein